MNEKIAFLSVGGALAGYLIYVSSQKETEIKEKKDDIPLIINNNIRNIIPKPEKQEILIPLINLAKPTPEPQTLIPTRAPEPQTLTPTYASEKTIRLSQPIINNRIYYLLNRYPAEKQTLYDRIKSDIKKGIFKTIGGTALFTVFFAGSYYVAQISMFYIDLIKLRLSGVTEIAKKTLDRLKQKHKISVPDSEIAIEKSNEQLKNEALKKFDENLKQFNIDEISVINKQELILDIIEKNSNSKQTPDIVILKNEDELLDEAFKRGEGKFEEIKEN